MRAVKFLVATTNLGKLRDFGYAAELAGDGIVLEPLPGLREIPAPVEDQATFEGNARVKAIYYSRFAPGELVLADDSGLEVDALGGAPGVRSARYAEDSAFEGVPGASTDERNNQCLLAALRDLPRDARRGRYWCALVAARDGVVVASGEGMVDGLILAAPQGAGGFGYDPYFLPQGASESMAELAPETRIRLSHRGRALTDLLRFFDGND